MIFLNHITLPQDSAQNFTEGLDQIFVYIGSQFPNFIPLFLFALFCIVLIFGYSRDKKEGKEEFAKWFLFAGFFVMSISLALSLIEGMINRSVVLITVAITLAGVIWLFFESRK